MVDISPTYRGFRRQALYALVRLLDMQDGLESAFQPEGVEDLAIFGDDGRLLEVVQVKDYKNPLVLANLGPRKPNGFFARLTELRRINPELQVRLVHFGELGSELKAVFEGDNQRRSAVARKVACRGYATESEVVSLLAITTAERVDEAALLARIDDRFRESVAGVDSSAALDLMTWWLYLASEQKLRIRQSDLITRLTNVGRFLHERNAYDREWYKTIEPLIDDVVVDERRKKLSDEFAQGIAADYAHIQANVDIPRSAKLQAISDCFGKQSVVVLRGASGQGKSALAYRYLHDFVPGNWRFRVRAIEGRVHAMSIATALLGHASALHVPIVVLIDVSAQDEGWPELARALSRYPSVKVLVSIREEDWKRTQIYGYQLEFEDIRLEFDREEAEQIWNGIPSNRRFAKFRGFTDAWTRFGEGNLLLEFVHFVTEGTTLRERLREQINQREEKERTGNASPEELRLLRLVAIAAESESRIDTTAIVQQLHLRAAAHVIASFEREYLLRVSDGREYLEGLHPVRSKILTDLLVDTVTVGNSWREAASDCLTLIAPNDVGGFLLHAAVRRRTEFEKLLPTLYSFRPLRWSAIAGVVRTLLWQGIHAYADANKALIAATIRDSGNGWSAILDTDLVEAIPGTANGLFELFESIVSPERMARMRDFRHRQRPKEEAFLPLKLWFNGMDYQPEPPTSIEDWRAFGEVLFWAGRIGVPWSVSNLLSVERLDEEVQDLPLTIIGDLVAGMWETDKEFASLWLSKNRPMLIERFRRQEWIIGFDDDAETLKAHFLTPPWLDSVWRSKPRPAFDSANPVHNEALMRIDLMRRLFPDREVYACQGFGHLAPRLDLSQDDSLKTGIPLSRLPVRWGPQVNGTFLGLVEFSHRPIDWQEYGKQVLDIREDVVKQFAELSKGIEKFLSSSSSIQILNSEVSGKALFDLSTKVRVPPRLPKSAVDEWGFIDESRTTFSNAQAKNEGPKSLLHVPALESWKDFLSPLKSYSQATFDFLNNMTTVLTDNERIVKFNMKSESTYAERDRTTNYRSTQLSIEQLSRMLLAAQLIRKPFRDHFADLFGNQRLTAVERQEHEVLDGFWKLWRAYALSPQQPIYRPRRTLWSEWEKFKALLNSTLESDLAELSNLGLTARTFANGPMWEGEPFLWITVDSEDAISSSASLNSILSTVHRSFVEVEGSKDSLYRVIDCWSQVAIVPLFRERSLISSAWRLPCSVVLERDTFDDLQKFYGIPHLLPRELFNRVGIKLWDDPEVGSLRFLLDAAREFLVLGSHFESLISIPELDACGEELFRSHIGSTCDWIGEANNKLAVGVAEAKGNPLFNQFVVQLDNLSQLMVELDNIQTRLPTLGSQESKSVKTLVNDLSTTLHDAPSVITTAFLYIVNTLKDDSD